jgi:endo-1,4-beta-D-glucanase Y/4-amino-4-deoxy-L-arabinose transferase-like glycosyltransferase
MIARIFIDIKSVVLSVSRRILFPAKWISFFVFIFSLLTAGLLHGTNMFHYPYFEGDEGTYMSQAWSVVKEGELAPYTYWYDHAPAGWYAIAGFVQFLGGDFFYFGSSLDTGRVFMLIVHLMSSVLIFFIVLRITKNAWIGGFSVVLFSISALEIYFQRRLLLDNIMIFWILAASGIQLVKKEHIWNFIFSGLFLALAVLTKITAILFFLPLFLAVYFGKHRISKPFRMILFSATFFLTYSVYFLYAFLKNELFPSEGSVNFISTFYFQMSRGNGGIPFWYDQSLFMQMIQDWIIKDKAYVVIAAIILAISAIVMPFRKDILLFMFGTMLYVLFLIRGGVILNFYILPLFPLIAILGGLLLSMFSEVARKHVNSAKGMFGIIAIIAVFIGFREYGNDVVFKADETSQQIRAVLWVKDNLKDDQVIIADNYALVDLWDKDYYNGKSVRNADWFYKVENDPAIRDIKYHADWKNFDYLLVNHEMLRQIERKESPIMQQALINSSPIAKWLPINDKSFVDEQRFISTNGDWVMIYAINGDSQTQLLHTWNRYKNSFMKSYGQIVDPDTNSTTSEGQSYAMLQAAWMNDKDAFNGIWLWTKHHFQNRLDDKLFSWKWKGDTLSDSTNASDADQDIALALLFGYRMFGNEEYLSAAKEVIDNIWRQDVREIDGTLYLLPMNYNSAMQPSGFLFNPSYVSPAWYRIFQDVDPEHDWNRLATDSYKTLNRITTSSSSMHLPLNWYVVNSKTGKLSIAIDPFGEYADEFSYDAFRSLWRVSMDWEWFQQDSAKQYLESVNQTIVPMYQRNNKLPTTISSTGKEQSWESSIAVSAGYLSALSFAKDQSVSKQFFQDTFDKAYDPDKATWASGNYYDSSWAWLGVGLYHHDLFNLWNVRLFQ